MSSDIDDRLNELERGLKQLNQKVEKLIESKPGKNDWWEKTLGSAKDDPYYAQAEKLGRQYRERDRRRTLKKLDAGS